MTDCNNLPCYTTGALPFKVRVVGSIPLPGTGSFFSPFFSSTSFLAFLTLTSAARLLCIYLVGLLTIDFDHKHCMRFFQVQNERERTSVLALGYTVATG